MSYPRYLLCFAVIYLLSSCVDSHNSQNWQSYLGDSFSSQYSNLKEINKSNVSDLQIAWTYSSNDKDEKNRSQIQCNPLVIDGILYGTSAQLKLFALDAETGEELWLFNPHEKKFENFGMGVNRGLVFYSNETKNRILYSVGHFLLSINADNGQLDQEFGEGGKINMKKGLDRDVDDLFLNSNTPGIIYKDLIIMGQRVSESTGAAPGHIRAFDVHTGEQKSIFKTIPSKESIGGDTWPSNAYNRIGGANVWAGFSLDEKRGIVYCPTGSASYDFYGGDRHGENLFANSILALDANDGSYKWHFQTIHHDIWDKDLPAPPNLMTIEKDGEKIDVVAQISKNGLLFVLDRDTGEPVYPIEEVDVPISELVGEQSWPTQPIPTVFPKFSRYQLTEEDLTERNDSAQAYAHKIWSESKPAHPFQPPSEKGTIIFPGFDGGGEWGGAAHDPNGILYVNSNEVPWLCKMISVEPQSLGEDLYLTHCANCHGITFEGGELFGNVPSLVNLKSRLTLSEATEIVQNGKGVMPSFKFIDNNQANEIYKYIHGEEDKIENEESTWPYPYRMRGYEKLYAPDGYPIITPPWGQLTAVDINSAQIKWQIPLGEHDELKEKGISNTGTENYGGPIVTKGGLIFIAASMDEKIRAFDKDSGDELWSADLPAAGYATPSTYMANGKQYVVIACGGGKLGSKSGDSYVAFSL